MEQNAKKRNERVWVVKEDTSPAGKEAALRIRDALGIHPVVAALLVNRGYKDVESARRFLSMESELLCDPFALTDVIPAVDRIGRAIKQGERITIYGDYDVDGVTAVCTLYLYLRSKGADVGYYIPNRAGEGYGVSRQAIDRLKAEGTSLIVTVDTGITANEEVEYAASLGIDTVVTDHHECRPDLPRAVAVVNPHRPDCPYPFKELAGVGVVFKLICAAEERYTGEDRIPVVARLCRLYADLVAIGTIADVMPIEGENRLIVAYGLGLMEKNRRPGLSALIRAAAQRADGTSSRRGSGDVKITSGYIGYTIAPRLNAAGRMCSASLAVELFLSESAEEADALAAELCEANRARQAEENRIMKEAYQKIEAQHDFERDSVIVLDADNWHHGVIGIVASRITERYGLPSILVSFEGCEDGGDPALAVGKGSGRSIKGLNLVEALGACEDLLVKYGGHELAAGLTVKRGDLETFRERINAYAREHLDDDAFKIKLEVDCEIDMADVNLKFAKELQYLEPYGTGNATPLFVMRDVTVKKITYTKGGEHTRLYLEKNGIAVNAMYFSVGEGMLGFENGDLIDLLFNIDINDYKNVQSAQMIVRDARLAESYTKRTTDEKKRYSELREGGKFRADENFIPTREDCAGVYTLLRREYRNGNSVTDLKSVQKALEQGGITINYVKLKYIFEIFNELQICDIAELGNDIYRFEVIFRASRTSIDKSAILRRLKTQCIDRVWQ